MLLKRGELDQAVGVEVAQLLGLPLENKLPEKEPHGKCDAGYGAAQKHRMHHSNFKLSFTLLNASWKPSSKAQDTNEKHHDGEGRAQAKVIVSWVAVW